MTRSYTVEWPGIHFETARCRWSNRTAAVEFQQFVEYVIGIPARVFFA